MSINERGDAGLLLAGGSVLAAVSDPETLRIPEVSSGFLKAAWAPMEFPTPMPPAGISLTDALRQAVEETGLSPAERQLPAWYHAPLTAPGNYQVKVRISVQAAGRVTLFGNHRQLIFTRVYDAPGQDEAAFVLHMGSIIPRGMTEPRSHQAVDLCLLGEAYLMEVSVEACAAPTIFLMGDSTVTDQSAEAPWSPLTSYSGWGQMLSAFMQGAAVSNHAHSGLTTESFRSERHWEVMQPEVKPGDWVLMQFGHNDQKLAHLQAWTGYADNLRAYVHELRGMGAVPVLVTPLARNTWFGNGSYNDLLAEHSAAVKAVGEELNVPVIDLHGFAMAQIIRMGMEPARILFYPGDWTHTNDHGAYLMAGYVAEQLGMTTAAAGVRARQLPAWPPDEQADRTVPPLALKQREAAQAQQAPASSLPERIDRMEDPITRAEAFELVIRACNFFSINVYNDHFDDVTGHETWAGMIEAAVMNGLVPPEMTEAKQLRPQQPARPYELAAILIRGALARKAAWHAQKAADGIPAWAAEAVGMLMSRQAWQQEWNDAECMTRGEALAVCRRIME